VKKKIRKNKLIHLLGTRQVSKLIKRESGIDFEKGIWEILLIKEANVVNMETCCLRIHRPINGAACDSRYRQRRTGRLIDNQISDRRQRQCQEWHISEIIQSLRVDGRNYHCGDERPICPQFAC
jgi:hypothetical protein